MFNNMEMQLTVRKVVRWAMLKMIVMAFFVFSYCGKAPDESRYLQNEYWREQGLTDILPPWTKYATDTVSGSFFSTLDANWLPEGDGIKYPSMIARHLFSYSAAYLLSGKDEYYTMAGDIKDFLVAFTWDRKNGGWFNSLNGDNTVHDGGKSTFVQVCVITGLAMYYFVTHDPETLRYIEESNDLLEKNVWDPASGGYYDEAENNWTTKREIKSFASQLAPVSGYLAYLYLATRDRKYLEQAERITDNVLRHMRDEKTGWVLESFDRNWKYIRARQDEEEINVGHNIEAAWMLLRLHLLNDRAEYRQAAQTLSDSIHHYGFDLKEGFWFSGIGKDDPKLHSDYTYWWIQAYGNMFDLCLASVFPHKHAEDNFLKGAAFWDTQFVDRRKGDTHFSVFQDGKVKDYRKANQFKSSYHSMEHSMLNYLYLGGRINPKSFTLYFRISAQKGQLLYPLPIEVPDIKIKGVRIGGHAVAPPQNNFITLPALRGTEVQVSF